MVIADIRKFFYRLIERFLCPKFIQIGAFVFQSVEVSLHWRVVIWVSCLTHALGYMDRFAEFYNAFDVYWEPWSL